MFKTFINLPFNQHLFIGIVIRLILIAYGDIHDEYFDVPFTDVDYKVFTDAARHVVNGESPYKRHTYRYSPIIAYLMVPNVILYKNFGKILFSVFDILLTVAVKALVEKELKSNTKAKIGNAPEIAKWSSLFWLHNPLSIAISSRGNADSFSCYIIILSIFFLLTDYVKGLLKYALSGMFLGISVHLRLYPLAYIFPMYLSLGNYSKITSSTNINDITIALFPNKKQYVLTVSCVLTLIFLTYGMYLLYGYEFLFETYIYHLFRKDTRHNFSVLFYHSYLRLYENSLDWVKSVHQLLELIILFVLSVTFGCEPNTLPLSLFCQTIVMVAYNSVITSQYFIWFLALLPLVVHHLNVGLGRFCLLLALWFLTQAFWLCNAYFIEFQGQELFWTLWWKSIMFFGSNIFLVSYFIQKYDLRYCFCKLNTVEKKD